MNDEVALPQLLREARKAAFKHEYAEAEALYSSVLLFPEMHDNLDVKMRYAYCAEKAGNLDDAIHYYEEIIETYRETGETGAADSLQESVEKLKQSPQQPEAGPAESESETGAAAAGEAAEETSATDAEEKLEAETGNEPLSDEMLMQELRGMGKARHLDPGDILCLTGDPSESLWLIERGKLDVQMPDYEEKDTLFSPEGAVTLAGEIGFFTLQRRSASLTASSEVDYVDIPADAIRQRQQNEPPFNDAMERLLRERWAEPVLAQHSVFERVNDIDRKRLAHAFTHISLQAGETLIDADEEHDGTYLLQSGCMFFTHHVDDGSQPMDEHDDDSHMISIMPGDMVHLGGLLRGHKSSYKIVTATPVQLLHLSREDFEPFTLRRPWIIQAILRYSRRPAHLQVMHPEDDYLWQANRNITLRRIV